MSPIRPALRAASVACLFGLGLLPAGPARAEFSLFGSAERTPANPFASNYASPPVRGSIERPRRARRTAPAEAPRPPREIPR